MNHKDPISYENLKYYFFFSLFKYLCFLKICFMFCLIFFPPFFNVSKLLFFVVYVGTINLKRFHVIKQCNES
jgi:hypothetical protein